MLILPRPPVVHGGIDLGELRALGLRPDDLLDFSANVNPYGPSPAVREALASVPLDRYPDRECLELRAALTGSLGVSVACILPGNGASELIWLTALAFLQSGDRVFVQGPTFSEYARAARLMRARVLTWRAAPEQGFVPDLAAIARRLKALRPRLVFLCNPNNPTGTVVPPDEISAWARQHPRTLFIVDEAYLLFAAGLDSALTFAEENVLVLRSLTKDCSLAGLRLGYAVGPDSLITTLRQAQPPWSVNVLAQATGVAALLNPDHRRDSLERLARAKQELVAGLTRLGLEPVPSAVHFFLLRVGNGAAFRQTLLRRGILVRDCASFGLPAHVRIATRRPEENQRLLAVIREVI